VPYEETAVTSYPVSALDVAAACTKLTAATGFLLPNTLFWRQNGSVTALGIYVPARRWTVSTPAATRQIPLPPLVFAGEGRNYLIFAVKRRPPDGEAQLYHAPCPAPTWMITAVFVRAIPASLFAAGRASVKP
jgi:hypothetical protein